MIINNAISITALHKYTIVLSSFTGIISVYRNASIKKLIFTCKSEHDNRDHQLLTSSFFLTDIQTMATPTPSRTILPSFPGYSWEWQDERWALTYSPVKSVYSPPVLHIGIRVSRVDIPQDLIENVGMIIGKDGIHFKTITSETESEYIFYRSELQQIEIWARDTSRPAARITAHFDDIRTHIKSMNPCYLYVPADLIGHVGMIIGKQGVHIKDIARKSQARMIVFCPELNAFAIRAVDSLPAVAMLHIRFQAIRSKVDKPAVIPNIV